MNLGEIVGVGRKIEEWWKGEKGASSMGCWSGADCLRRVLSTIVVLFAFIVCASSFHATITLAKRHAFRICSFFISTSLHFFNIMPWPDERETRKPRISKSGVLSSRQKNYFCVAELRSLARFSELNLYSWTCKKIRNNAVSCVDE